MAERSSFELCSGGDIILHPDGTLTIEAEQDYGDSEIGWGAVSTVVTVRPDAMEKFRKFLGCS